MEDKRKLANDELENTLNSGILSVVPQSQLSFENMPDAAPTTSDMASSNIMNNFNVNVNVSGGNTNVRPAVNETMQRMLPNLMGSPEEIKKNSSVILEDNSSKISNETEINNFETIRQEVLMSSLTPNNYSGESFQMDSYIDSPSIPLFSFAKEDTPLVPNTGMYSYSDSVLRETEPKYEKDHIILKNLVYNSFAGIDDPGVMVSPYSTYDNSVYVQNQMGEERLEALHNLYVENNTENNLEIANEMSRERERYHRRETDLIGQLSRESTNKRQLDDFENHDIVESTDISPKEGTGVPQIGTEKITTPSNLNGAVRDIPSFITKMNSPPNWRTVLG